MQTLAIIRPEEQLENSKKIVESFGYRALAVAMVDIVPLRDSRWFAFLDDLTKGGVDYLILTSANGARICAKLGLNAASIPKSTRVVAIGPATKSALLNERLRVDLMPLEFSSHGIVKMLNDVAAKNIWVLRSAFGSSDLIKGLQINGATVNELVLYTLEKRCGPHQQDFIEEIVETDVAAVLFTSTMTVRAFFECADRIGACERLRARLPNLVIGAIGIPTKEALRVYNVKVDAMPNNATFGDLVTAVHSTLKTV